MPIWDKLIWLKSNFFFYFFFLGFAYQGLSDQFFKLTDHVASQTLMLAQGKQKGCLAESTGENTTIAFVNGVNLLWLDWDVKQYHS